MAQVAAHGAAIIGINITKRNTNEDVLPLLKIDVQFTKSPERNTMIRIHCVVRKKIEYRLY